MKKASIRKSALKIVAVLVVLVAVATAAFFRSKPMVDPADSPRISLITADYENGGESYRSTMEQTDISQKLNNELVALFQGTQMRNVRFLRPQSFRMEPGSVYLNVWVETDRGSMLVNLSTNSDYNSAQFGDTHYAIVNGPDLYQKVYDRLSPLLVAHGSPWSSTEPPTATPAPTPTMTPPPEEPEGPPSQSPTDTPPQVTQPDQYQYSTFMQNIKVYNVEDTSLTPEVAAQQLMTLFLDDLSRPSQVRTFQITQYKNLRVEVLPTTELKATAVLGYGLTAEEVGKMFWIVLPEYEFQYTGTLSPIGECPSGKWLNQEDQGNVRGFLLKQTEHGYSLQSRYQ